MIEASRGAMDAQKSVLSLRTGKAFPELVIAVI